VLAENGSPPTRAKAERGQQEAELDLTVEPSLGLAPAYLRSIGRVELADGPRQVALAKRIEKGDMARSATWSRPTSGFRLIAKGYSDAG